MTQINYRPIPYGQVLNSNGLHIEKDYLGGWLLRFGEKGPSVWFPDPIRLCWPEPLPAPDWSQAPAWAEWWAVDADGRAYWHLHEPELGSIGFIWTSAGHSPAFEKINIPLGVDWRLLKVQRPKEASYAND